MPRDINHDYRSRCIYHITMTKAPGIPAFSCIAGAPVVIHRSDPESLIAAKRRRWKHLAENGGVLISPFISAAEKEVRRQCEDADGKIILLSNKPLGEREKPSEHNFGLCARGRLLILAPATALPPGRETFLRLNAVAESIARPENTFLHR